MFSPSVYYVYHTYKKTTIYSDDEDLRKYAAKVGIEVVRTWELPLPAAKQINIDYKRDE